MERKGKSERGERGEGGSRRGGRGLEGGGGRMGRGATLQHTSAHFWRAPEQCIHVLSLSSYHCSLSSTVHSLHVITHEGIYR